MKLMKPSLVSTLIISSVLFSLSACSDQTSDKQQDEKAVKSTEKSKVVETDSLVED